MVIIQLTGEELRELFRNPELLCVDVIRLIWTVSLKRVWFHLVQCRTVLYTGLEILVYLAQAGFHH